MIYIITGIAKSGKTLISQEMKHRFNLSVFSTDYIMMMLHYSDESPDLDINASDSTVARKIEPYVYGLIKAMVHQREDVVIEGVHFTPEFSERLLREFHVNLRIVYLGYKDMSVEEKVKELKSHRKRMNNPWIFNHKGQKIEEIVAYMIKESDRLFNECFEHNLLYFEVEDINQQKDEIIDLVMN